MEQTFQESVLEQLHLPKLRFRADYGRLDPDYAEFLEIGVTEVYGSSSLPEAGDNYLICGRYSLKEQSPTVTLFAAAYNSVSTGREAFLISGADNFALDIHVVEATGPARPVLSLMVDTDTNAIDIYLEQESSAV